MILILNILKMRYDHSIHIFVVRKVMFSIMMKTNTVRICSNKEESSEHIFYYKSFWEVFILPLIVKKSVN